MGNAVPQAGVLVVLQTGKRHNDIGRVFNEDGADFRLQHGRRGMAEAERTGRRILREYWIAIGVDGNLFDAACGTDDLVFNVLDWV